MSVLIFFNEGHCYGCINHGITDMKHPNKADAYSGGHLNVYLPFGGCRRRPNTWTGSKEDVHTKTLILVKPVVTWMSSYYLSVYYRWQLRKLG